MPIRLVRDRLTWTLYAAFAAWGWFIFGFSSTLELVAADLGVSRVLAGLHPTAIATGSICAGFAAAALTARAGRRTTLLASAALLVAGAGVLVLGPTLPFTLTGCFLAGLGGPMLLAAGNPALAEHQGAAGPAAVSEANALVTLFGVAAPLAAGLATLAGASWRLAIGVTIPLTAAAGLLLARLPREGALDARRVETGKGRLLPGFWFFAAGMLVAVGVEVSTTAWVPGVLTDQLGIPSADATSLVSVLLVGMLVSRTALGRLSLRFGAVELLVGSYLVAIAGWALFWLAPSLPWAVTGLAVAGLGYGGHFPLGMVSAMSRSAGARDRAAGIVTTGQGCAAAVMPFGIAALSQATGLHTAFAVVGVMLVLGLLCVLAGQRTARKAEAAAG